MYYSNMKYIPALLLTALFVFTAGCVCVSKDGSTSIYSSRPELSHCNGPVPEESFDQDRENCYAEVAVKENNVELCNEIKVFFNIRNLCIQKIAQENRDPELCQTIKDDQWRRTVCLRVTGGADSKYDDRQK